MRDRGGVPAGRAGRRPYGLVGMLRVRMLRVRMLRVRML
jgi:hypothetical protein